MYLTGNNIYEINANKVLGLLCQFMLSFFGSYFWTCLSSLTHIAMVHVLLGTLLSFDMHNDIQPAVIYVLQSTQ